MAFDKQLTVTEIRTLLGSASDAYSASENTMITQIIELTASEISAYCNRELYKVVSNVVYFENYDVLSVCARVVINKLERLGQESTSSMSISGLNESYTDYYSADMLAILNRHRKIKVM